MKTTPKPVTSTVMVDNEDIVLDDSFNRLTVIETLKLRQGD